MLFHCYWNNDSFFCIEDTLENVSMLSCSHWFQTGEFFIFGGRIYYNLLGYLDIGDSQSGMWIFFLKIK